MGLYEPHHLEFYAIGTPGDGTPTSIGPAPPADELVRRWRDDLRFGSASHLSLRVRQILHYAESPTTWTYARRNEPAMVEFLTELRILIAE